MESKSFLEKNRRWLTIWSRLAGVTGWILIAIGFVLIGAGLWNRYTGDERTAIGFWEWVSYMLFSFVVLGLIMLLVRSHLSYILDERSTIPGWFARHGSIILYFLSAAFVLLPVARILIFERMPVSWNDVLLNPWTIFMYIVPFLPDLARILVCVGLAQASSRVLDMVNESKTLV